MNRKLTFALLSVCLFTFLWIIPSSGEMSSSSFQVPAQVFDGGGSKGSSTNFGIIAALGQPTAIGSSQSAEFQKQAGFIPQISKVRGDIDGDGQITLQDYYVFRTAYGSCGGDDNFIPEANLDGDDCITINDYRILRNLYAQ